jgi:hypothetical protein
MHKTNIFRTSILVALTLLVGTWTTEAGTAKSAGNAVKKSANAKIQPQIAKDSLVKAADSATSPASLQHRIVAYYFHGDVRCVSCRKIEAYTKEAIDSAFGDALKSGRLEWRVVNTDSSQNEHFLQDYQLFTKSVVVSDVRAGKETRWKNLDKVWELLGDQDKFHAYIQAELRPFVDSTK